MGEGLTGLIEDLIRIDSSTKKGANDAIKYCQNWFLARGMTVKILENNGFKMLICEVGKGEKTLILNGHVDVVSGKEDQFHPYQAEGQLFGRGSADMKAGVAAMMCALADLKDIELQCKIQLQLVTDEEIGGANCTKYLTESGYLGDFVICAESTHLGIGLQAKGVLQLDILVRGKSAHGSRPWEGENAILRAYDLYRHILGLPFAKESSELFRYPSINLAKIKGGEVYNKVPDTCIISLDIRFLPTQNKQIIIEQIRSVDECEIDIILYGDPVMNTTDDTHMQNLISQISANTSKQRVEIFGQHGFADTRYFSRFNIPAIEFGPAGGNWHGDNEYVNIESVETYKQILIAFGKAFK